MGLIYTDRTAPPSPELTQNQKLAQQAAEFLMAVATTPDPQIAAFSSAAYQAAEAAFNAILQIAYPQLTEFQQAKIRSLLAFYGPNDSLTDTYSYGIKSYVTYTLSAHSFWNTETETEKLPGRGSATAPLPGTIDLGTRRRGENGTPS